MSDIKFFYCIKVARQLTFDGRTHEVAIPIGDCHLVAPERPGTTLCGEYKESLKTKHGTRKTSEVKQRPLGMSVCKKCEEKWKARQGSPWSRWHEAVK